MGKGIKIAVVDTGIDFTHKDLDAVAGTIAAENNGIGVVGVSPDASLYGVKVLNRKGSGWTSDVIAGIDWSNSNRMQVIRRST